MGGAFQLLEGDGTGRDWVDGRSNVENKGKIILYFKYNYVLMH